MFHGKKSFKETVKKSYSRLIVPFIVFSILGECVNIFAVLIKCHPIVFSSSDSLIRFIQRGYFVGNPPLWFLLSLFVIKCTCSLVKSQNGRFTLLVISLATSIFMHITNPPVVWLMNIPMGLFFYVVGNFLSDKQYKNGIFLTSLVSLIIIALFFDSSVSIVRLMTIYGSFYIWILYALVAVIVANNIFKSLTFYFDIKGLRWLGKNSMLLYVSHWPIMRLVHGICSLCDVSNPYYQLSIMLVCLASVILVEYKIIQRYKLGYLIGN